MKGLLAYFSDYVIGSNGLPIAGATATCYPTSAFAVGTLPSGGSGLPTPAATATTDSTGRFTFMALPPDDYHILVQYTPPGGAAQNVWRYHVPIAAADLAKRAMAQQRQALLPRTLARLMAGLATTILAFGDDTTVGYNATGTASGGWPALLAAALATAYPQSTLIRADPHNYAVTMDAPIPSWDQTTVQTGTNGQIITVVNAGVRGDTVLRVLRRFANLTAGWPGVDCVICALGQAESISTDAQRYVLAGDFAAQLEALVNVLRTYSQAEVVIATPHANPTVTNIDDYAAAARAVAARTGAALVDMRQLWLDNYVAGGANDGYDPWLNVGVSPLFPTDAGHAAIALEMARPFLPAVGLPFRGGVLGAGKLYELVRVPNQSSQLAFAGSGWTTHGGYTGSAINSAGGFEVYTAHAGDTLTITGRFTDLSMLGRRFADCGQIGVVVDGGAQVIVDLFRQYPTSTSDLSSADGAMAPQDRVQLAHGLTDSVHTVVLTLLASKNALSTGFNWRVESLELGRWRKQGYEVEAADAQSKLQAGVGTVSLTSSSQGTLAVTFPVAFTRAATSAPTVVATATDPNYFCAVSGSSDTGFTLTCVRKDGTNVTANIACTWLAFG